MHLRATDTPADLGLREVLAEAELHYERVAFGQNGKQTLKRGRGFGSGKARVFASEPLAQRVGVAVGDQRSVERVAAAGLRGFGRLDDVFDCATELLKRARPQSDCGRSW